MLFCTLTVQYTVRTVLYCIIKKGIGTVLYVVLCHLFPYSTYCTVQYCTVATNQAGYEKYCTYTGFD